MLIINNLSGGYDIKDPVLQDLSFKVPQGDFVGIIGPNGSGKSTLLKFLTKVLLPQKGEILFEGKNITKINLKRFCQKVAFVPQNISMNFPCSVHDLVLLGRIPHQKKLRLTSEKDLRVTEQALQQTGTLHYLKKQVSELSAGECQKVVIAKALAQEPVLLFLDEPTAHLDIGHQVQVLDLLKTLNKASGLTIVIVLHDLNLASEYCNRLLLLNKGKIFSEGSPQEVLTREHIESVYQTRVLLQKNLISARPQLSLVPQQSLI